METKETIMSYESVLPEKFDGTFKFSNPTEKDFIGVWDKEEYLFPAGKTVPMIMPAHSPLEIQHIRKKFAKDLAEREFYNSKSYKDKADQEGSSGNRTMTGIHQAATYSLEDLTPFIQKCLQPLDMADMTSQPRQGQTVESKLHKDDDGSFVTSAIDKKTSLKAKALEG